MKEREDPLFDRLFAERVGQPGNDEFPARDGDRVVITKNRTYHIPADVNGIPIEEHFPNTKLPDRLTGAKVYLTKDGPVIAVPESEES